MSSSRVGNIHVSSSTPKPAMSSSSTQTGPRKDGVTAKTTQPVNDAASTPVRGPVMPEVQSKRAEMAIDFRSSKSRNSKHLMAILNQSCAEGKSDDQIAAIVDSLVIAKWVGSHTNGDKKSLNTVIKTLQKYSNQIKDDALRKTILASLDNIRTNGVGINEQTLIRQIKRKEVELSSSGSVVIPTDHGSRRYQLDGKNEDIVDGPEAVDALGKLDATDQEGGFPSNPLNIADRWRVGPEQRLPGKEVGQPHPFAAPFRKRLLGLSRKTGDVRLSPGLLNLRQRWESPPPDFGRSDDLPSPTLLLPIEESSNALGSTVAPRVDMLSNPQFGHQKSKSDLSPLRIEGARDVELIRETSLMDGSQSKSEKDTRLTPVEIPPPSALDPDIFEIFENETTFGEPKHDSPPVPPKTVEKPAPKEPPPPKTTTKMPPPPITIPKDPENAASVPPPETARTILDPPPESQGLSHSPESPKSDDLIIKVDDPKPVARTLENPLNPLEAPAFVSEIDFISKQSRASENLMAEIAGRCQDKSDGEVYAILRAYVLAKFVASNLFGEKKFFSTVILSFKSEARKLPVGPIQTLIRSGLDRLSKKIGTEFNESQLLDQMKNKTAGLLLYGRVYFQKNKDAIRLFDLSGSCWEGFDLKKSFTQIQETPSLSQAWKQKQDRVNPLPIDQIPGLRKFEDTPSNPIQVKGFWHKKWLESVLSNTQDPLSKEERVRQVYYASENNKLLKTKDGTAELHVRISENFDSSKPSVVLYGGKDQTANDWLDDDLHKYYSEKGFNVISYSRRGEGLSTLENEKQLTEQTMIDDAEQIYELAAMMSSGPILLHGTSLGGGIAAQVAVRRNDDPRLKHLILDQTFSTFESAARFAAKKYFVGPIAKWLLRSVNENVNPGTLLDTKTALPKLPATIGVTYIQATEDELISPSTAGKLLAASNAQAKLQVKLAGGHMKRGFSARISDSNEKSNFETMLKGFG